MGTSNDNRALRPPYEWTDDGEALHFLLGMFKVDEKLPAGEMQERLRFAENPMDDDFWAPLMEDRRRQLIDLGPSAFQAAIDDLAAFRVWFSENAITYEQALLIPALNKDISVQS